LAKEIKEALIEKKGLLADYIQLIQYYEKAQWKEANQAINTLQLPNDKVPDSYHTAVQWANEQMKALGD
jgi:c-di-GMP-related signal transduction protein